MILLKEYNWWEPVSSISVAVSLIITAITFIMNFCERKRKNEIEELDLYLKIKTDILSENSKKLARAIRGNNIFIDETGPVYFLFTKDGSNNIKLSIELLDHLEDLAIIYNKGLIKSNTINSGYGSTINLICENVEVKALIAHLRERYNDTDIYSGLDTLYSITKIK